MKLQTLTIDAKTYSRVIAAFIVNKDQKKAFESISLCQIGDYQDAKTYAESLDVGMEIRLAPLSWTIHPNLREPILCEAWINECAHIVLVRAF